MVRSALLILFLGFTTGFINAQTVQEIFHNKAGNYRVAILKNWIVKQEDVVTMIYAPQDGPGDSWKEYVDISIAPANGISLENSFSYYTTEDFPGYYKNFKIVKRGEEVIDGAKAKWILFSFSGSVDNSGKETTLYNVFYLIKKGETLYFLNAIAEASLYSKFESNFLTIIRSIELL